MNSHLLTTLESAFEATNSITDAKKREKKFMTEIEMLSVKLLGSQDRWLAEF